MLLLMVWRGFFKKIIKTYIMPLIMVMVHLTFLFTCFYLFKNYPSKVQNYIASCVLYAVADRHDFCVLFILSIFSFTVTVVCMHICKISISFRCHLIQYSWYSTDIFKKTIRMVSLCLKMPALIHNNFDFSVINF